MTASSIPLQGRFVRLEPLSEQLKDELRAALDVDPEAWSVISRAGFGEHFEPWWTQAVQGGSISYAVRDLATGAVVGTTSYLHLRPGDRACEIGSTFLRPEVRGTAVNPEAKRLMLAHAFEGGLFGQPAVRVELITDARNVRSQAAIAKLGAVREGVLRRHKITWTGHVRDTVVFSITELEWPAVRDGLDRRLASFG